MATKSIEAILSPRPAHFVGDGFRVHNFIPALSPLSMKRMDPFILLDYHSKFYYGPTDVPRGVGVHPHRGFETVTIAYEGSIEHHDSHGGGGIIHAGDVQWMTAAGGILHKEFHESEWSKKGGDMHMVQIWVNLPAVSKMSSPKYQAIVNSDMGKFEIPNQGGVIEVIAGAYKDVKGPASTFSPINMMNAKLKQGHSADFQFPSDYNTALLVINGNIVVNGNHEVASDHFVLFGNEGEDFSIKAKEDAIVLVLSAEPLNEPIAAQGPFVMNTNAELMQAYQDFHSGKFGYLED